MRDAVGKVAVRIIDTIVSCLEGQRCAFLAWQEANYLNSW
jgi:hypothetical protein